MNEEMINTILSHIVPGEDNELIIKLAAISETAHIWHRDIYLKLNWNNHFWHNTWVHVRKSLEEHYSNIRVFCVPIAMHILCRKNNSIEKWKTVIMLDATISLVCLEWIKKRKIGMHIGTWFKASPRAIEFFLVLLFDNNRYINMAQNGSIKRGWGEEVL